MGDNSKIDWTDATWNPIRGCSRCSPGCAHCYAEALAVRFCDPGQWGHGIATRDGGWTGAIHLAEDRLTLPLRWKRPRRIFVTSISDPFHPSVSDEMLDRIFAVMTLARHHTFQLLTKRSARMRTYLDADDTWLRVARATVAMAVGEMRWSNPAGTDGWWPLPNLWVGVSVENQGAADERIPRLLATPAARRFLSCEPLLGPLDLGCTPHPPNRLRDDDDIADGVDPLRYMGGHLDWIIAGGESGPNARPMHPDWIRDLCDQCAAAGVPFFFKQWGEWAPTSNLRGPRTDWVIVDRDGDIDVPDDRWPDDTAREVAMERVGKRAAGHLLDGREHRTFPPSSSLGA